MSFVALRFDVAATDAERWADALLDAGALSVDLSDPGAGGTGESPIYGEPGEPAAQYWPFSRLDALFAADADAPGALADAASALEAPAPPYQTRGVAERDWVRDTQRQFEPIEITPSLWVVPSWCSPPDPAAIHVTLDPGLAFGTGSHPTTRLCLAWLAGIDLRDAQVLDYGCGSGILAIAAAKLGARGCCGVDVDPQALEAASANALQNHVGARFVRPDALGPGSFDVVVANILANPLILLAPALAARVATTGRIALAGVLDAQQDDVIDAYAQWFKLAPWRQFDGWVLLAGERKRTTQSA